MRILLFVLVVCICATFTSCRIISGVNYDNSKKVQMLDIGMSKQEAIGIMGKDYIIESASQEEDGLLEVVKYYSDTDVTYLLHFLNGELILFNRYYPPQVPQQNISITHDKK